MSLARSEQGNQALSILYPDGERELWLTQRTFAPGDVLERNRRSWVVVRIDEGIGRNAGRTVVLMPQLPEASQVREVV
jgi:hypothetical protein